MSYHSPWRPLITIAVTSATVATTYSIYQCVSAYGWEGTFWYIWEGDPYPPAVRDQFHALDDAEEAIAAEQELLDVLEEAYARAQLDSVDGSSDANVLSLWTANMQPQSLEKKMAGLSHNLDKCAAQVDAVPSARHNDIKTRKKYLSNQIVQLMERADVLVARFKDGQE